MLTWSSPLADRFRNLDVRDGVLLRGPAGWAEFSPFWDYDDAECVPWLRAAVEAATLSFPDAVRTSVPVNATVPAVGPERAAEIVRASGCATVKVKVAQAGQSLADDLDRVAAVRDALGPAGAIRVDANAAWSVDEAVAALPRIDRAAGGLQYAEQPCAAVDDLARVRRAVAVPIAADESIRRASDPHAVVRAEAADVIVVKVQPLGGVRACLALAEELGLPVTVSSALESSVGVAAGVALAAALPRTNAAGLATVAMLRADVAATPLLPVDGELPVGRVVPDAITPAAPDLDRAWRDRLDRVAALAGIDLQEVLA
ncbi:o-succinylbenzoate synthase [Propioniciclava sp. MC1595]|uniref:o-succinylbenzoate synthase n=1 Tax=Propioniciclava sp. MC1595 TaxID=2760308 RepID=UPI0016624902|nr:o-succinylbenzoate synthase [Propioniciclava sp. MC1595]MBB1494081.1 o-succinylbenzoate synthase [Propioniciclava sp. MC1595]QTE27717.1 o-succinylbenzoate synthase [Propioniciclava sp. MC1595]